MPAIRTFIARRRKAIAGILAVGLVYVAQLLGLRISQDQGLLVALFLVGLFVHQAPKNA